MKVFGLKGFLLASLLLGWSCLQAETAPEPEWVVEFGTTAADDGHGVAADNSGNVYVTGSTSGNLAGLNSGLKDAFVVKFDRDGNQSWARQFGTSANDDSKAVAVDGSGNVYVAGETGGAFEDQNNSGGTDMFVAKYDSGGNRLWLREVGTPLAEYVHSVATDSSGNVYVTGETYGAFEGQSNSGDTDVFLIKYDSGGNLLWVREFGSFGTYPIDMGMGVAVDASGNAYVAGGTYGTLAGQSRINGFDAFLAKFDTNGNQLWVRQFGTMGTDSANAVTVYGSSTVYVGGGAGNAFSGQSWSGSQDVFVAKYDSNGTMSWVRQLGSSANDTGASVTVDGSGNLYVGGTTYGTFAGQISSGNVDAFVAKYDSNGTISWLRQFGTSGGDYGNSVAADVSGNLYLGGNTDGAFEGQSHIGNYDVFLAKFVVAGNIAPVADAGEDQTVHPGSIVTLDGSGSSDPDENYPLTYEWNLTSKPAGSSASLSNTASVSPTFTPDIDGTYTVQLVVTDSLGKASVPDTVTINTSNAAPVAEFTASPQAVTTVGTIVELDGSQSYDPDGDGINFQWSWIQKPGGSNAAFSPSDTETNATFEADVKGDYIIELNVSDTWGAYNTKQLTVSFDNIAPVAAAGAYAPVVAGDTVTLDGSASSDANGDPLTYQWSLVSSPAGSAADSTNETSVHAQLNTDLIGDYIVSLKVNDGLVWSEKSNATITAIDLSDATIALLNQLIDAIKALPDDSFKNKKMQTAMVKDLGAAIKMVADRKYDDTIDKLTNDVLPKVDGCLDTEYPDKTDWIIVCKDQRTIYGLLSQIIEELKNRHE